MECVQNCAGDSCFCLMFMLLTLQLRVFANFPPPNVYET